MSTSVASANDIKFQLVWWDQTRHRQLDIPHQNPQKKLFQRHSESDYYYKIIDKISLQSPPWQRKTTPTDMQNLSSSSYNQLSELQILRFNSWNTQPPLQSIQNIINLITAAQTKVQKLIIITKWDILNIFVIKKL